MNVSRHSLTHHTALTPSPPPPHQVEQKHPPSTLALQALLHKVSGLSPKTSALI